MVNSLAGIVLASIGTVGIVGGGIGALQYTAPRASGSHVYGNKDADELAKAVDKMGNNNGILETSELAAMLKDMGYKGAPIPDGLVPHFQVGGTKDLEVQVIYLWPATGVRVPEDMAKKYIEKASRKEIRVPEDDGR